MKDLGELKYFLGLEVLRSKEGILVNQRKYALELIESTGLSGARPVASPLEQNIKLTSTEFDRGVRHDNMNCTEDSEVEDKTVFQRLIGRLIYLTHTRPDITFAVHHLSQFMQSPKKTHFEAALRIVRYVKNSPGQGVFLKARNDGKITAYCDSDWASCPISRRSVTGYCIKIGESLISWKSKKQTTVARSSAEAEYRSMAMTTSEIVWLKGLLKDLGNESEEPVTVFCDSKAALQIAANSVFHERTKHIEIDCHFVREKIQKGIIRTDYIPSAEQLADIMTKALGVQQHKYLMNKLGIKDVFKPPT
ncbi:cysteine-rich RLK (RECEPTOR-like protein kinase) 8 [Hibiscus trionum]|uniref:Cysteine-rich RLK (RECEPTOR-like protein kinase) 8 n=1 Tax=Hibiscus trionum TaxID=183268 RepID=A0A9W7H3M6_HIBTR|nr:cysteine-rich RLK (RECEPTOR-like protein kinase) 8 [Hibiscus trionum]